jgi:UPF0755 protein
MARRLIIALVLLVVGGLATAGIVAYRSLWLQLSNPELQIHVEPGTPAKQVLRNLADHKLLPSRLAGRCYLALYGDGRAFHYGHFLIAERSRPVDVLEKILEGDVETVSITIVEGLSAHDIAAQLAVAGFGDDAQWRETVSQRELVQDLAPEASSLEGFLFPDTYQFAVGVSAGTVARHMVDRFRQVWQELAPPARDIWGTPFEIVTLASLVEAETSLDSERSRVAGVFANRLRRGMLLQCDPTVVYALKRNGQWQGRLLRKHWLLDDPYNTYRYPGLPPAPINSPGESALAAALEPERHSYLYFVARPGGGHTFSQTLSDHNRAVARLRRSRR